MAQPVVYRVAQACRDRGMATLRFNFRGVGGSRGTYSGTEEYRDVEAAAAYLRGQLPGLAGEQVPGAKELPMALAGYSFGSVMAAMAATGAVPVQALALVAFVVAWEEMPALALERLAGFRGPVLAVCGDRDDLAPPREVERVLAGLGLDFSLSVVEGADHFFENRQRQVGERVAAFLDAGGVERRSQRSTTRLRRSQDMDMKGSKTEQNLMKAFAGESQARNRYTFYARVAADEGYMQIANLFLETADNERAHAFSFFSLLDGGMPEFTASYPAGPVHTTVENLRAAAEGELAEWGALYPGFAQTAEEEGLQEGRDHLPQGSRGGEIPRAALPEAARQCRSRQGVPERRPHPLEMPGVRVCP